MLSFFEQRAYIMDGFKWEDVHRTMVALNWTWHSDRIPTLDEMKSTADNLLSTIHAHMDQHPEDNWYSVATGGFEVFARRIGRVVRYELAFKAVWQESQWEDPHQG